YGPSRLVLEKDFSRFNVKSSFVDTSNLDAVKASWRPETKILYIETPTNPTLAVTDIQACAEIAHEHGALLIVDNTFMSPILQKPFRFGADIVLHSVTKFLNGHSDVVGGVLVFQDDDLMKRVRGVLHYLGGTMDPHQAWLVLRGIRTLAMRV
ncbi:MAG: aminotransferase class I/II-fold pyridoxal phosphate-dependent enzyme, partial [Gemmatimonadota bacterium]